MDVLSHAFIPYAVLTHFGRPRRQRVAAAVGGFAPDLDVFWAWATRLGPEYYPLAHRGFSHTLLGAPLLALALWFLLTRPRVSARWWRLNGLAFDRSALVPLVLGALSHLVLDMLTITGVPLVWPLSMERFTLNWFFFSIPYMLLVSGYAWVRIWRRRADDGFVRRWFAILLVIVFAAAAVRLATYPDDLAPNARATPGTLDWRWFASHRNETGVIVTEHGWGAPVEAKFFLEANRTLARPALEACRTIPGFQGWQWRLWGTEVADANGTADGGWNVTFRDSVRLYLESTAGTTGWRSLFGRMEEQGLKCHVDRGGTARLIERPSGFWG